MHPQQTGDTYLHDDLHYKLSVDLGLANGGGPTRFPPMQ